MQTLMRPLSLLVVALSCANSAIAQSSIPEWVVEDVWAPAPHHSDDQFSWQSVYPAGDVDRDGMTDLASVGQSTPDFMSGRSGWSLLRYSSGQRFISDEDIYVRTPPSAIHFQNTKLKLRTPTGAVLLLDDASIPMVQAYDADTGVLIGSVPQPPPPVAGVPPTQGMDWLFPAGDVNHDGYDDAFYQTCYQPYGYCGLIDGATLSVVWQQYGSQVDAAVIFYSGLPDSQPDLDGDGTADLLFGQVLWNGANFGHRMTALSGADGSTIWQRVGSQYPYFRQACGRDLDADGVGDFVIVFGLGSGPSVQAWSGKTGTTIWTFASSTLDPLFPTGWHGRNFRSPMMSQSVGTLREEVVFHAEYVYNSAPEANRFIHLDGATGLLLDVVDLPPDIRPWSSDLLEGSMSSIFLDPGGDCDRDGFQEYAVRIPDPGHTPAWSSTPSFQLVFLGQKNLLLPASARIGSYLQADLSVPSAPGFDFLLLASSTFDPAGGLTVQGWRTHLRAQDTLLQKTWTSRSLSGQLGPLGNGRLTLRLPNQPSLVGQRLYFRALVRNPATGEVWTRSSLAQVDVLP